MSDSVVHSTYDFLRCVDNNWRLNDRNVSAGDGRRYRRIHGDEAASIQDRPTVQCLYCKIPIPVHSFYDNPGEKRDRVPSWYVTRQYWLATCSTCGFWRFVAEEGTNKCMDSLVFAVAASVAKRFSDPIPPGCSSELAQYLASDLQRWNDLSPTALEILVRDIFRANYVGAEVVHVGRPGDLGVDVLFVDTDHHKWLIQVKRRRKKRAEGVDTIQSLLGAMVMHDEVRGIVVSTAGYFSPSAVRQTKKVANRGMTVRLIDRGILHRMIGRLLPDRPWLSAMSHDVFWKCDEEVRDYFLQRTVSARAEATQRRLF